MERLFRRATSLPLHNYKAKTDARLTMQKIKPSTAVKLLCVGWHSRSCLTYSSGQNYVWTVADRMGRTPLATRQKHPSTPGTRLAEVALSSPFNSTTARFLILALSNLRNRAPPTAVFEIRWGGGHKGIETLMMSSLCNGSKHNLHFKSSDVLLMRQAAN